MKKSFFFEPNEQKLRWDVISHFFVMNGSYVIVTLIIAVLYWSIGGHVISGLYTNVFSEASTFL
jgi:hypothetical protein